MPVIGPIVGGAISYFAAQDAADSYSGAADRAAGATKFSPYNVYSGFGSGAFKPASAGTPGYWAGGAPPGAPRPAGSAFGGLTARGRQYGGTGTWVPGTPATQASATATLNPNYQGLRDQYLSQARGFGGALTSYDPNKAAQDLYGQLTQIGASNRQQQTNAFENRLLSQGQTGLEQGGENPLMRAYQNAQGQEDLQRQLSAFGMSQDVIDKLLNRSISASNAAVGLDQLPLELLNQGGVFGGRQSAGNQFGANAQLNAAGVQAGTNAAFWQSIGQGVGQAGRGGAFSPAYNDGYSFSSQYNPKYGGAAYGGSSAWAP